MTMRDSFFTTYDYEVISATRNTAGDGTAVSVVPSSNERIRLKELSIWMVDPATENTITLKLGDTSLPPFKLSDRSFSMGDFALEPGKGIIVNLSGTAAVGVWGRYLVTDIDA